MKAEEEEDDDDDLSMHDGLDIACSMHTSKLIAAKVGSLRLC